ncbi:MULTISPECIES: SulP family inorganic anion transporter [Corallincola]|uniref:SulP family inorganic anion transporter n=2 Tax=Corallincola TaxID=1775176 RepID=A0ABY1WN86_9GAMM|nr:MULTISPECIES: SulP family inorganic anion transporter [Corallincola]TAA45019.1 SulP family inorganic anion transporter [Corallincola spongiicola]TCI03711.1 SulP family inorganic anion transporter [Corallincola luteus]
MNVFNAISLQNIRGDLFGGLTAAIVSLPLALAFGIASGAGAEAGIYGALLIGLFAALFGGTPTLISEPTGPMTVIMAAVITNMLATDPENGIAMAFTVVMIAGLFQIAFGALKLGKYITLMPYSVISGFMSGIGFILLIMQLAPFLGQAAPSGGALGTLKALPELISNAITIEIFLAFATLAVLVFTPKKIKAMVPPQLIALVGITLVSVLVFDLGEVRRIGEIEVGLPGLVFPTFTADQITTMILDGMVLGMLGCIDSMLTSVIADNLTRTEHKSDKELIGQGVGNLVSGLFGGLPGAGATMGTVVNIQAGGRTALSGVMRVAVLGIAVFGAADLLEVIPLAVLAGIAAMVGLNILDWSFIKRSHRVSWYSTLIMYAVMLLTVFVDLIVAVGVGVFVANIIIIEKLSRSQAQSIKAISDIDDEVPLKPREQEILNQAKGKILLVYLSGPLIFGLAKALSRQHQKIEKHQTVVIDLSEVSLIDDTISLAVENTITEAIELKKHVYLVVRTEEARNKLARMGLIDLLGKEHLLDSRTAALELALQTV